MAAPSTKGRRRSTLTNIHSVMSATELPVFSSVDTVDEKSRPIEQIPCIDINTKSDKNKSEKQERSNSISFFLKNVFGSKHLSMSPESISQRSIVDSGPGGIINRGVVDLSTTGARRYIYHSGLNDSLSSDSSSDGDNIRERVYPFFADSVGVDGPDDLTKPPHVTLSKRGRTESEGSSSTFLSSQNSNSFFGSVKKLSPSVKGSSAEDDISIGCSSKQILYREGSGDVGGSCTQLKAGANEHDSGGDAVESTS